jgi:4-oxalocrotonate tautomerase family enzyme
MPLVKITLRTGTSHEYRAAILGGVHAALVGAFRIPDHDRHQMLFELDADHFEIPQNKSEKFVVIEIIAFAGRSFEAKKNLYAAIVQNLAEDPGIPGNDVLIIIHEPPAENWGIRGGRPASEVDLGFTINV